MMTSLCFRLMAVGLLALLGMFSPCTVAAQSTYSSVQQLISARCTGSCHTAVNPSGGLVLNGSGTSLYNALVNVMPNTASAAQRGEMLVVPGYPMRSFLLRKINNGAWEEHERYRMTVADGATMPSSGLSLSNDEIELIRQWILFGCPDTGKVVDTQVLFDFYNINGGMRTPRPAPPADSLGFQLQFGPFFLPPQSEKEYSIKYALNNPQTLGITKIDLALLPRIHHFNIEKHVGNGASLYPDGFRDQSLDSVDAQNAERHYVASAQFSQLIELPEGTAYLWEPNLVLDLNGHCNNIYPDSVLAIEAYFNFYTTPVTSSTKEMLSVLTSYSGYNDSSDFVLPPFEQKTFTDSVVVNDFDDLYIDIFLLTAHTHQFGERYMVWKRTPEGEKGELIYNGNYDATYSFDQGFWDYEHPTVRYFDDCLGRVQMKDGIIQEATFYNTTNDTIYYGRSTKEEMMNIFMQFTIDSVNLDNGCNTTSSEGPVSTSDTFFRMYPNPSKGTFAISVQSPEPAIITVQNLLGQQVLSQNNAQALAQVDLSGQPPGVYLVSLQSKAGSYTQKLLLE